MAMMREEFTPGVKIKGLGPRISAAWRMARMGVLLGLRMLLSGSFGPGTAGFNLE
ncbi:MAG: hypothetical protein ACR2JE_17325 [Acidobacteriaceae bacterium]